MRHILCSTLFLGLMVLTSPGASAATPAPAPPPEGFEVKLTKVTPGQKKISANGTYKCPDTHEVIAAVLILNRVPGGQDPQPPIIVNIQNGTWSITDAAVPAGTYDVYAKFTFRKKNPQVGDVSFDVASNVETNVTISP